MIDFILILTIIFLLLFLRNWLSTQTILVIYCRYLILLHFF